MADNTVSWKGAVPMDQFYGNGAGRSGAAQVDPHSVGRGFDIRPAHGANVESAMKGAIPYVGTGE